VKLATVDRIEDNLAESQLKNGILDLHLVRDGPTWTVNSHMKFLLVESVAFFEGYVHTLHSLQHLKLDRFPMAKYIVQGVTVPETIKYPKTLQGVDFSRMIRNGARKNCGNWVGNMNNTETWPQDSIFGFNPSQYQAFKAALTQEISIIQGPPGTGKTFLGTLYLI
jgi:hypothetical protein